MKANEPDGAECWHITEAVTCSRRRRCCMRHFPKEDGMGEGVANVLKAIVKGKVGKKAVGDGECFIFADKALRQWTKRGQ